jgi:hypothetical protein
MEAASMRISTLLATLSVVGFGGMLVKALPVIVTNAAAQTAASAQTDVSAQRNVDKQPDLKPGHRTAPRPPQRAAPGPGGHGPNTVVQPGGGGNVVVRPGGGGNVVVRPGGGGNVVAKPHPAAPPRVIAARHGPRVNVRVIGGGPVRIGGRNVTIVRGPRYVVWRGHRRSLVPLAVLGALTVGGVAYAAYGYVPVEQNYCDGFTEDGCQFMWTDVPTEEGDLVPQCVTYCPAQ